MKKINVVLVVLFCIFGILGCQKSIPKIENDIESCEQLYGTWTQTRLTEVALRSDETDLESVIGFTKYNTFTSLTFDMNQNMQTKISYQLVSYVAETEEGEFSQEELDLYFNQKMIIDSKYKASEKNIQYENTQISINGSDFISYDEYMTINPQTENKIQTLSWKIKDDKLILSTYYQNQKIETEYYKISQ